MKKILLFVFMIVSNILAAQQCPAPMPAPLFKQKLSQMALQPNDPQKLQFAKSILPGSCLLSSQIKDLAMVFSGDYYRYEFCIRAWKHTFDRGNFFEVYDAFAGLSSALRLYDYTSHQSSGTPASPPPQLWYPDLAYPVLAGYQGITGCALPLAEHDFDLMARNIVAQNSEAGRRTEALKLISANCLSAGQMMKLATLFNLESNRLAFLKEVFGKCYDLENCSFAAEVFSHVPYKTDWQIFCSNLFQTPDPVPPVVVCEVSATEYEQIRKSISDVSVTSTRVTLAKQIISTKKCFTVKQIAGIIRLFTIESAKLEVALFAYDYCTNKDDYYQLTESFSTTSSKNKLLEFINSR